MGRTRQVAVCARTGCSNSFLSTGKKKYCCHQCNITHLNRLRTPEYNAKHWAEYYRKNQEYLKLKAQLQRSREGRDTLNKRHRLWYAKNPSVVRAIQARRRSAKELRVATEDAITNPEWEALKQAWEYRCAYCKRTATRLTQDHVKPLSKGGTHTMDNIVPACQPCNTAKGNRSVADFLVSDFLCKRLRLIGL